MTNTSQSVTPLALSPDVPLDAIKFLSLNAFVYPSRASWNPYLWAVCSDCKRVQHRLSRIAVLASNFDLVCLQNLWSPKSSSFCNSIGKFHTIPTIEHCSRTSNTYPDSNEENMQNATRSGWCPMSYCLYDKTGGLFESWSSECFQFLPNYSCLNEAGRVFPSSESRYSFFALDVETLFPGKQLGIFNVHIPRSYHDSQKPLKDLENLRRFVLRHVWKALIIHLAGLCPCYDTSRNTADDITNKKKRLKPYKPGKSIKLNCWSFVLAGDFTADPVKNKTYYQHLLRLGDPDFIETEPSTMLRDLFVPENNPRYSFQPTTFTLEKNRNGSKAIVNQTISRKSIQQGNNISDSDPTVHKIRSITGGNSLFHWNYNGKVDHIFVIDRLVYNIDEVNSLLIAYSPKNLLQNIHLSSDHQELVNSIDETIQFPSLIDNAPLNIRCNKIYNLGTDIVTQDYGEELSDHWGLSAVIQLSSPVAE